MAFAKLVFCLILTGLVFGEKIFDSKREIDFAEKCVSNEINRNQNQYYGRYNDDYDDYERPHQSIDFICSNMYFPENESAILKNVKRSETNSLTLQNSDIPILYNIIFIMFKSVKEAKLSSNFIKIINANSFKNASNLYHLTLSNNSIDEVPNNTFIFTPNLQVLDLSNNKIAKLNPNSFYGLEQLTTLDLNNNRLSVLGSDVTSPIRRSLMNFSIEKNPLMLVDLENEKQLGSITIANKELISFKIGPINTLQLDTSSLENVEIRGAVKNLFIRNDAMPTLTISNFKAIENLTLVLNQSSNLELLKEMSNLKFLRLSLMNNSNLQSDYFLNKPEVVNFRLKVPDINEINFNIFKLMPNLETLDLSDNDFESFDFLNFCTMHNVKTLRLRNIQNATFSLDIVSKIFPNLQELDITDSLVDCSALSDIMIRYENQKRVDIFTTIINKNVYCKILS